MANLPNLPIRNCGGHAKTYANFSEVPWYRREPGALIFLLALVFTPVTVALCVIVLTGDVYKRSLDANGNLEVWGVGNKVAAGLILLIQIFQFWATSRSR